MKHLRPPSARERDLFVLVLAGTLLFLGACSPSGKTTLDADSMLLSDDATDGIVPKEDEMGDNDTFLAKEEEQTDIFLADDEEQALLDESEVMPDSNIGEGNEEAVDEPDSNEKDTEGETDEAIQEDDVITDTDATPLTYTLLITNPSNNSSHPVGTPVFFAGTTNCYPATVAFVADTQYPLGSAQTTNGSFSFTYTFNTPGPARLITATATGSTCSASGSITISIVKTQPDNPLNVPYFCQYENSLYPSSSCQNTSIAMVLRFYGWSGTPDTITAEWGKDHAQSPSGLAEVFNYYANKAGLGVTITPRTNGTFAGMKAILDKGRPVIVHGYFTQYGHVVVTAGYDATGYFVNDPAGQWSEIYQGGYTKYCDYGYSGKGVHYGMSSFEQAIGPDGTIWYHEPSR